MQDTFNSVSPRLTAQFKPTVSTNLYASWARGFRPGGFNAELRTLPAASIAQVVALTGAGLSYDQESIDEYEAGFKGRFLDGRATFDVAVYSGKLNDQQVNQSASIPNPLVPGALRTVSVTSSVGAGRIHGIELEGGFQVSNALLLEASAALNDTEVRKYGLCAICASLGNPDPTGKRFAAVPRTMGSLAATWRQPLVRGYDGFVRWDYRYQGSVTADPVEVARTAAAHRVNLRIGAADKAFSVEGYVTNLLDSDTPLQIARSGDVLGLGPNSLLGPLPDRRQWGLRASYGF